MICRVGWRYFTCGGRPRPAVHDASGHDSSPAGTGVPKAYPNASYVVATSATPAGPFTIKTPRAAVAVSGGGDITLFVDSDQTGYVAYDAWGTVTVLWSAAFAWSAE